jgi:hypothetical protein
MLTATYFFVGLAAFVLAALVCFSKGQQAAVIDMRVTAPTWSQEAKWSEIKTIWIKWQAQCQEMVSRRQEILLCWGRTFAFCAAICIVGIALRAGLDGQTSVSRIWTWLRPVTDLLALSI